jgi:hypothetical protein
VCSAGAAESPGWLALPFTDSLKAKEAALARQFMARAPPCRLRASNTRLRRYARDLHATTGALIRARLLLRAHAPPPAPAAAR